MSCVSWCLTPGLLRAFEHRIFGAAVATFWMLISTLASVEFPFDEDYDEHIRNTSTALWSQYVVYECRLNKVTKRMFMPLVQRGAN